MKGIIISGQPRSGKSTLVKSFKSVNDALAVMLMLNFLKLSMSIKDFQKILIFQKI